MSKKMEQRVKELEDRLEGVRSHAVFNYNNVSDLIIENPSEAEPSLSGNELTWKDAELVTRTCQTPDSRDESDSFWHSHMFRLDSGEFVMLEASIGKNGIYSEMKIRQQKEVCRSCKQEV